MKRETLSTQIRRAITESPLTPYRICRLANIDKGSLARFLAGERSLTLDTLDAVGQVLGLSVVKDGRDVKLAADAPRPGRPPRTDSGTKAKER